MKKIGIKFKSEIKKNVWADNFIRIFLPFIKGEYKGRNFADKIVLFRKRITQFKLNLPHAIAFETISHCILNCEFCILQSMKWYNYRRKNMMGFEEFKKIINDIHWFTTNIEFSGGEPLLNQDIFKMLNYARQKNIYTLLATNGILLGYKNNIEKIIANPPDKILISYDSAIKEDYENLRRKANSEKGDFEILNKNIKELVELKNKNKQKYPIVILQMVLTKKNISNINLFWEKVKDLGADFGSIKPLGVWPEGSPEYDKKMLEEYIVPFSQHPISRHEINNKGEIVFFREPGQCAAVHHAYIGSGGEVIPCWYILVKTEVMGNAIDNNFFDIWNSEKYKKYREKMLSDWANPLCHRCIGIGGSADLRKTR